MSIRNSIVVLALALAQPALAQVGVPDGHAQLANLLGLNPYQYTFNQMLQIEGEEEQDRGARIVVIDKENEECNRLFPGVTRAGGSVTSLSTRD